MKRIMLVACAATVAMSAYAQKTYTVNYAATAPTIDGVAAAAEWQTAPQAGGDFVAHDTGVVSTEQTVFRVLWDANNMYLLMQAVDNNVEYDPNFAANNAAFTFTKDDLELFLSPKATNTAGDENKYQMVFYPQTNAAGQPVNGPTAFIWAAASDTAPFPGVGSWPAGSTATVKQWITVIPIGPATSIVTMEAQIPWAAFNLAAVNGGKAVPPNNGDQWLAQPARAHNAASANNTGASKWNPSGAGFKTKPWGVWTFTGAPNLTAAQDWQHMQ